MIKQLTEKIKNKPAAGRAIVVAVIVLVLASGILVSFIAEQRAEKAALSYNKIVRTEEDILKENKLNLADFVKCPFNEKIEENADFAKYFLRKFGKPDEFKKGSAFPGDLSTIIEAEQTLLGYNGKYRFKIWKCVRYLESGSTRKFKTIKEIRIYSVSDADLKYGLNSETTIKDIDRLFGKPKDIENYTREKDSPYADTRYYYEYDTNPSSTSIDISEKELFWYSFDLRFRNGTLSELEIETRIY